MGGVERNLEGAHQLATRNAARANNCISLFKCDVM